MDKPWAILLCMFNDVPTVPHLPDFYAQHFTPAGLGTLSEFEYWRDISYGNFDMANSKVFGWLTMNDHGQADLQKLTMPRDRGVVVSWGIKAAGDARIDLSPFVGTIVVVNATTDVGVTGLGSGKVLLGYGTTTGWGRGLNQHEMGHAIGLDHSFSTSMTPCATGDSRPGAYCDKWDLMSYENVWHPDPPSFADMAPGLNAPNLEKLGWLAQDRVFARPDSRNSVTVTLAALGHPDAAGFLMAKIPSLGVAGTNVIALTVEFRRADQWDRSIPNDAILLHEERSDGLAYLLLAAGPELLEGGRFAEPECGVEVIVERISHKENTARLRLVTVRSLRVALRGLGMDPAQGVRHIQPVVTSVKALVGLQ